MLVTIVFIFDIIKIITVIISINWIYKLTKTLDYCTELLDYDAKRHTNFKGFNKALCFKSNLLTLQGTTYIHHVVLEIFLSHIVWNDSAIISYLEDILNAIFVWTIFLLLLSKSSHCLWTHDTCEQQYSFQAPEEAKNTHVTGWVQ